MRVINEQVVGRRLLAQGRLQQVDRGVDVGGGGGFEPQAFGLGSRTPEPLLPLMRMISINLINIITR